MFCDFLIYFHKRKRQTFSSVLGCPDIYSFDEISAAEVFLFFYGSLLLFFYTISVSLMVHTTTIPCYLKFHFFFFLLQCPDIFLIGYVYCSKCLSYSFYYSTNFIFINFKSHSNVTVDLTLCFRVFNSFSF